MTDQARARRLADRIKVIVAQTLEMRIKDPRLGFVTITDVRVTGDLQNATVFYTVLGDAHEHASSAAALASATGVVRSEVGKQTGLRLTPTITFVQDVLQEDAARIDGLLAQAAANDASVQALATGAAYAGEADPYRRREEPADEDSLS